MGNEVTEEHHGQCRHHPFSQVLAPVTLVLQEIKTYDLGVYSNGITSILNLMKIGLSILELLLCVRAMMLSVVAEDREEWRHRVIVSRIQASVTLVLPIIRN
jgi:hypothetical protein